MQIPLMGGANEGRSPNISPEVCINWFYEKGAGGESLWRRVVVRSVRPLAVCRWHITVFAPVPTSKSS
jgi:hypothetical protein